MKFQTLIAITTFAAAMFSQIVSAQELTFGSPAPKLELKKFIKGEEVKSFEKGKIYVVELWATWCRPCLATIPHLTELQKKYEDVTIIGVAILEEDQSTVPDFVNEMGDKMDYRVALDLVPEDGEPNDGKIVENWMNPAEQQGIPTAFIINGDSKIAWIGHPGEMEEPLDKVVNGKWDLVVEAQKYADAKALEKKMAETFGRLQRLFKQFSDDGEPKEILSELENAATDFPDRADIFKLFRFQVLALSKGRADEAVELGTKIVESEQGEDPRLLNNIAWFIVDPNRDTKADSKLLKLALKVAIKADNLSEREDAAVADTLAKAYFDNGDFANAVKTQERVVELAEGTRLAADPGLKRRLRQYKRALDSADKEPEEKKSEK